MKYIKSNSNGAGNLLLVLIISAILILVITSILLVALINARQASQVVNSQLAYVSAEGVMHDTLTRLSQSTDWPVYSSNVYKDFFVTNGVTVFRTLTRDNDGAISIDISTAVSGSMRRIEGTFDPSVSRNAKVDVVLVIDSSGSMAGRSIEVTKEAAAKFINIIFDASLENRVALVSYSSTAETKIGLTNNPGELLPFLDQEYGIQAEGLTNIESGLINALEELSTNPRPNTSQIVVLMSDGVPQKYQLPDGERTCEFNSQPMNNWCLLSDTGFRPNNQGNLCTERPINLAKQARSETDIDFYSIVLSSNYSSTNPHCTSTYQNNKALALKKTVDLGRYTLLQISSQEGVTDLGDNQQVLEFFLETDDEDDLTGLFERVAKTINQKASFQYSQTTPEPINSP